MTKRDRLERRRLGALAARALKGDMKSRSSTQVTDAIDSANIRQMIEVSKPTISSKGVRALISPNGSQALNESISCQEVDETIIKGPRYCQSCRTHRDRYFQTRVGPFTCFDCGWDGPSPTKHVHYVVICSGFGSTSCGGTEISRNADYCPCESMEPSERGGGLQDPVTLIMKNIWVLCHQCKQEQQQALLDMKLRGLLPKDLETQLLVKC